MVKFASDENFDNRILRGLLHQEPDLDVVRVQDTKAAGTGDPAILEWAAQEGRILLTHEVKTLIGFAYERVRAGKPMAGVLEVKDTIPIGRVIDYILLAAGRTWKGNGKTRCVTYRLKIR